MIYSELLSMKYAYSSRDYLFVNYRLNEISEDLLIYKPFNSFILPLLFLSIRKVFLQTSFIVSLSQIPRLSMEALFEKSRSNWEVLLLSEMMNIFWVIVSLRNFLFWRKYLHLPFLEYIKAVKSPLHRFISIAKCEYNKLSG